MRSGYAYCGPRVRSTHLGLGTLQLSLLTLTLACAKPLPDKWGWRSRVLMQGSKRSEPLCWSPALSDASFWKGAKCSCRCFVEEDLHELSGFPQRPLPHPWSWLLPLPFCQVSSLSQPCFHQLPERASFSALSSWPLALSGITPSCSWNSPCPGLTAPTAPVPSPSTLNSCPEFSPY